MAKSAQLNGNAARKYRFKLTILNHTAAVLEKDAYFEQERIKRTNCDDKNDELS